MATAWTRTLEIPADGFAVAYCEVASDQDAANFSLHFILGNEAITLGFVFEGGSFSVVGDVPEAMAGLEQASARIDGKTIAFVRCTITTEVSAVVPVSWSLIGEDVEITNVVYTVI